MADDWTKAIELKCPPPLLALLLALLMWWVSRVVAPWPVPAAGRLIAALVFAVLGSVVDLGAKRLFIRVGTTVNPLRPGAASAIVQAGMYRFTRNPMYLGRSLQLLGWGCWLANGWSLLGVVVFVLYIDRFQIRPEERVLSARFGHAYDVYRAKVRRWL